MITPPPVCPYCTVRLRVPIQKLHWEHWEYPAAVVKENKVKYAPFVF